MKKIIKYSIFVVLLIAILIGGFFSYVSYVNNSVPENKPAVIKVINDKIYYKGPINEESYNVFKEKLNSSVKTLVINSGGGDVDFGMKLGDLVYDNKLDLVIEEICFSSCANYIFPAAKNKFIKNGSFVGWHGSTQQAKYIAKYKNVSVKSIDEKSIRDAMKVSFPGVTEESIQQSIKSSHDLKLISIKNEIKFFKKIGVNNDIALYGHFEKSIAKVFNSKGIGWTYSIKDMEKFGVYNVTYEMGEEKYPSEKVLKRVILLVVEN